MDWSEGLLRKLRAVVMIAIAWGLIWLPAGTAFGLISNAGPRIDVHRPSVTWFAIAFVVWGAVSGAAFAILLALMESGRSITGLSLRRLSLWGALGCMGLPIAITGFDILTGPWSLSSYDWIPVLVVLAASAVLGGACAAGTVAAVRRASV